MHVDRWVDGKIKSDLKMLVNNFSISFVGMPLAILTFLGISQLVEALCKILADSIHAMELNYPLPLSLLFIKLGKILVLNNAIKYSVFSLLDIELVTKTGKSLFFLIVINTAQAACMHNNC